MAEAREAKGNKEAGDRRPVSRITFMDYYDTWIATYAGRTAQGFSERSREIYGRSIDKYVVNDWGSLKLADIEPVDVRTKFTELRERDVARTALHSLRASLSAMFATAVDDGALRANPIQGLRLPVTRSVAAEEHEAKALTRAELALVLAAVPDESRLFFEFLAHTGLRISEAIGLRWEHVELGPKPRVRVREQMYEGRRQILKSRHSRRDIPLAPGMATRLRGLRTSGPGSGPVFCTRTGTEISRANMASRVLKPAVEDLGLPWVSFHTFRHTCASLLFAAGRNVKQVQEWLGHSTPSYTLETYVHLLDEGIGDAAFLDDLIASNPGQVNSGSTKCPATAADVVEPNA
jgi:integrase